ncbi:MAG: hypothetical protein EA387_16280 [Nitriliruptor sp.]|nr:MAG: hypothetical protein EA387_16280 [Nitriliruptor sp.]
MLDNRAWLREDVFSWTQLGQPWPRPGLIANIAMAGLFNAGGAPLLILGVVAVFVLTVLLLLRLTTASPAATFSFGLLAVLTMASAATPRPVVLQLPLLALTLTVLERERRHTSGTPMLWCLPILAIAWVNLHGSFVFLFVLIGSYGLGAIIDTYRSRTPTRSRILDQHQGPRAAWRLLVVGVLSMIGIVVNPFGAQMLVYPLETLATGFGAAYEIDEWRPVDFADPRYWPFLGILGLSAFALIRSRDRLRSVDPILLAVFGLLGLTAYRNGPVFAAIAFPIGASLLSGRPSIVGSEAVALANRSERAVEVTLLLVVAVSVAAIAWPAFTTAGNSRADAEWFGAHAIDAVAGGEYPQPIWNSYDQGTYLIWHGWPDVLVSMDSRSDLHGLRSSTGRLAVLGFRKESDRVREHIAEWNAERDAPARFAAQGIQTVLVERVSPLVEQLEDAGWHRVEEDERAVVLLPP